MSSNVNFIQNSNTNQCSNPHISLFTNLLLETPSQLLMNDTFKTRFPSLTECNCDLLGRVAKPVYREAMELEFLNQIQEKFPDKQTMLKIASVGSGQCFQELSILAKLMNAGYSSIQLELIDVCYAFQGTQTESIKSFQSYIQEELLKNYPKGNVTLNVHVDFKQYIKEIQSEDSPAPLAFLLIDIDAEEVDGEKVNFLDNSLSLIETICKKAVDSLLCYTSLVPNDSLPWLGGVPITIICPLKNHRSITESGQIIQRTSEKSGCWVGHFNDSKMVYKKHS
jgi:hypothetical protein